MKKCRSNLYVSLIIMVLITFILSSCSPKFSTMSPGAEVAESNPDEISSEVPQEVIEAPSVTKTEIENAETKETTMEEANFGEDHWVIPELAALKQAVLPYFDASSPYFMGKENEQIFREQLFQSKLLDERIPVFYWQTMIRSLFLFPAGSSDEQWVSAYLPEADENGYFKRESAVAGFMKLLSMRYPIQMGGSSEDVKASEEISDIGDSNERYEFIVRLAYSQGLTDKTVAVSKSFRPNDYMTYAEALSMASRVFNQYGLPPAKVKNPETTASQSEGPDWMVQELENYYEKLRGSSDIAEQKRIDKLALAENILKPDTTLETWNSPLALGLWQQVFTDVLGLSKEDVLTYTSMSESESITYDVAAICMFKLGYKIEAFDIRDATEEEINTARRSIPDLANAKDISKFSQMVSSGILEGIRQKEGFTSTAAVTRLEALLLTKRIVERMRID